jgi:hypothetical protein
MHNSCFKSVRVTSDCLNTLNAYSVIELIKFLLIIIAFFVLTRYDILCCNILLKHPVAHHVLVNIAASVVLCAICLSIKQDLIPLKFSPRHTTYFEIHNHYEGFKIVLSMETAVFPFPSSKF